METKQSGLLLSQDQKSFISQDHLHHSIPQNNLDDLGHQIQQMNAESNIQIKYYQQYKKIYFTSYKLWLEIRKQLKIKEGLTSRLSTIDIQLANLHKVRRIEEDIEVQEQGENDSKRRNNKRMRRTAQEIVRKFVCTAEFCDRCYGSEGSLQQHIKLKHPELYKKETESEQF